MPRHRCVLRSSVIRIIFMFVHRVYIPLPSSTLSSALASPFQYPPQHARIHAQLSYIHIHLIRSKYVHTHTFLCVSRRLRVKQSGMRNVWFWIARATSDISHLSVVFAIHLLRPSSAIHIRPCMVASYNKKPRWYACTCQDRVSSALTLFAPRRNRIPINGDGFCDDGEGTNGTHTRDSYLTQRGVRWRWCHDDGREQANTRPWRI